MGIKSPFSYIKYPQSEGLWNNQWPALSVCMKTSVSSLLRDVNGSGRGGMSGVDRALSVAPQSPFARFQDMAKHVPLSPVHGSVVAGQ